MGLREIQAEILAEARVVTKKPKLRQKDIMEWSTGEIDTHEEERSFFLPKLRVYVSILITAVGPK